MKKLYIETIEVRSNRMTVEKIMPDLKKEIKSLESLAHVKATYLMMHDTYIGDMLIIIVWGNAIPRQGSSEGLALADNLGQTGAVHHKLWTSFNTVF